MKRKLMISAVVASIAITPMLICMSDAAVAQSQRKTGSVIRDCYNKDGKLVRCSEMNESSQKDSNKKSSKKTDSK
jgi:hypothetical protein